MRIVAKGGVQLLGRILRPACVGIRAAFTTPVWVDVRMVLPGLLWSCRAFLKSSSITMQECFMAIWGESPSHAVTTWIGCRCISAISRLARRLWKGRGHGLRPARLLSRMNCGRRLHARHPPGFKAFSRRREPIT